MKFRSREPLPPVERSWGSAPSHQNLWKKLRQRMKTRSFRCIGRAPETRWSSGWNVPCAAGVKALISTTDWSLSIGCDWGSPAIPEKMNLPALITFAPEWAIRPRWTLQWLKAGLPDLTAPNLKQATSDAPTFFGAYGEWQQTPLPTREDIEWLREEWGGKFMLKGVTRVDDAKRATRVSTRSRCRTTVVTTSTQRRHRSGAWVWWLIMWAISLRCCLTAVVRRGEDVAKALAFGALAVMIGRAYLCGLGANGQTVVENVLDLLRMGLDSAVLGLGHSSISQLSRDDFLILRGLKRGSAGRALQFRIRRTRRTRSRANLPQDHRSRRRCSSLLH